MLHLGGCGTRRHVIGFKLREFDCSCFMKPHVEVLSSSQGINIKNRTINTYPAYFSTRRRLLFWRERERETNAKGIKKNTESSDSKRNTTESILVEQGNFTYYYYCRNQCSQCSTVKVQLRRMKQPLPPTHLKATHRRVMA